MSTSNVTSLNDQLAALVACCADCSKACGACAEAFVATGMTDTFRNCALVCADCADICRTTALVASRYSGGDAGALNALLMACAKACHEAAGECEIHGDALAAQCVRASLECKRAATRVKNSLRWR